MHLHAAQCPDTLLVRPSNWDEQVNVVSQLAKSVPGIVRIDLYASESDIIFSEFTYTTGFCGMRMNFNPRVADGLLYAVQYGVVEPAAVTPELVRSIIHDTSWIILMDGRTVHPESFRAFPSPLDLCEYVNTHISYDYTTWESDKDVMHCLKKMKKVATAPLRCVALPSDDSSLTVSSDVKKASFLAAMTHHIDWERVLPLLMAVTVMSYMKIGTRKQKNQYMNNMLYLVGMLLYTRLTLPYVKSTFSAHSILDISKQSFEAFVYVHPIESPHIALSHFATYWFYIAAWRSKSTRNLLFWALLVETVAAGVNEYVHLLDDQDVVHCTRVIFKDTMKNYAFDNLIREYVLPPFFVYGYLLPKFIMHWVKGPMLWLVVGMVLLGLGWIHKRGSK